MMNLFKVNNEGKLERTQLTPIWFSNVNFENM